MGGGYFGCNGGGKGGYPTTGKHVKPVAGRNEKRAPAAQSQGRDNVVTTQIAPADEGVVAVTREFIETVINQLYPYFIAYAEEIERQMAAVEVGCNRVAVVIDPRTERLEEDMPVCRRHNVPNLVVVRTIAFQAFPERIINKVSELVALKVAEFLITAHVNTPSAGHT